MGRAEQLRVGFHESTALNADARASRRRPLRRRSRVSLERSDGLTPTGECVGRLVLLDFEAPTGEPVPTQSPFPPHQGSAMTVHQKSRRVRRALSISAAPILLAACAVSQQQEVQLGNDYAAQIATQLPLIKDPTVVNYISALGNSLARVSDTRGLAWHFSVVDSKEVNAFAVPGGWIYVNRGLIERAQNMSQVAGVLGHEIAHVTRRHSVQQMQQAQGANVGVTLLCTLTKACASGATQTAINLGGTALFAKFSRSDEQQADEEGVKTAIKARIDPSGIPGMFEILLAERKSNPSAVDAFFATHPLEQDRITATRAQIASYPAAQVQGLAKDTPDFQAFKRRLMSLPPSPAVKAQ
jgi:beta-barrel assembly-enhancing protease